MFSFLLIHTNSSLARNLIHSIFEVIHKRHPLNPLKNQHFWHPSSFLRHLGSKTPLLVSHLQLRPPTFPVKIKTATSVLTHTHTHTHTLGYSNTDYQIGHSHFPWLLLLDQAGSIMVFWRQDKKQTVKETEETAIIYILLMYFTCTWHLLAPNYGKKVLMDDINWVGT